MSRGLRSMKWRRNRKLVACLAAGTVALVALFGGSRVSAIASSRGTDASPARVEIHGSVPLFAKGVAHEIEVEYDPDDYRRAIETYRSQSKKDSIEAKVTIDGTTIDAVGLRLKGNSTLGGLRGRGGDPGGRDPGFGGGGLGRGGGFGPPGRASADQPEQLPWLIEFDTYVEGQRYEGYETLAVRAAGSSAPETALNESLALRLIERAGEPAVKGVYVSFAINGGEPVPRFVVEEPDKPFVGDNFDHDGVLYKSLSTGRFAYLGDDPIAYADSFRQITRKNEQDLQPLIGLLRWTSKASDKQFAADLARHVDVESFARYIALHNLLLDWDDMAGPGQNYYLWYDLDTKKFSVLSWDLNFAFSGDASQGPLEFGRGGPGGGGLPGLGGAQAPGADDNGRFGGGGGGFGGRGGNALKERVLAAPGFRRLYLETYERLYSELLASGYALEQLDRLEQSASTVEGIDRQTLTGEAERLRTLLEERSTALAKSLARNG